MFKHIEDVHRQPMSNTQARCASSHHIPGRAHNPLPSVIKFPSKKLSTSTKTPTTGSESPASGTASISSSGSAGIIPLEDILNYYNHGKKTAALAKSAHFTAGTKPKKSFFSPTSLANRSKANVFGLFQAEDSKQSLDSFVEPCASSIDNMPNATSSAIPGEHKSFASKSLASVSYNGYFKDFKNFASFSDGSNQFRPSKESKRHLSPVAQSKTLLGVDKGDFDTIGVQNDTGNFKVSGLQKVRSAESMQNVPQFTYYPKNAQMKACKTIYLDEDPWDSRYYCVEKNDGKAILKHTLNRVKSKKLISKRLQSKCTKMSMFSRPAEAAPYMIPKLQREKENQGLMDLNRLLKIPLAKPECIPDLTQQIDNLLDDIEKESKELNEADNNLIIEIKEETEDETYGLKDKSDQYAERAKESVTEDIDFFREIIDQSAFQERNLHLKNDNDISIIAQSHDLARPILIKEEIDLGVNGWTDSNLTGYQCSSETYENPSMEKDRLLNLQKEPHAGIPSPVGFVGSLQEADVNKHNDGNADILHEFDQNKSKKRKLSTKRPFRERYILAKKSEKLDSECTVTKKLPTRPKSEENVDNPLKNDKVKKADKSRSSILISKKKSYVDKKLAKVPDKNPYAKEAKSFRRKFNGVTEEKNVDIDAEIRENVRQSLQEPYCSICAMLLDQSTSKEDRHIELETRIPKQSVVWITPLFRTAEETSSSASSVFPTSSLLSCNRCKVCVHAACYLSEGGGLEEKDWICDRCDTLSMSNEEIICILCTKSGGALKNNGNNVFYHVRCAVLVPELSRSREFDLSCIPSKRWNLSCIICDRVGKELSVHCMASKGCMLSFHLSCAFANKVDCALGPENSVIFRCSFCLEKFKLNDKDKPDNKFPPQVTIDYHILIGNYLTFQFSQGQYFFSQSPIKHLS